MIDSEIVYVRAESAEDAVHAWASFAGKKGIGNEGVRYLGGSTEIVTGARKGSAPVVVIDVKRVEEARRLELSGGRIHFGAALALNEAGDSRLFPLLSATVRRIADRTTRNRLSLGGNVAGTLPYREAVLPLLLADATILTIRPAAASGAATGSAGAAAGSAAAARAEPIRAERPLRGLFEKRLRLEPGELIVGFSIRAEAASLPWKHYRATRTGPVDYPLVTACFLDLRREGGSKRAANGSIGAAVSGLQPYPVFFETIEALRSSLADPSGARTDQRASADYRIALAADMVRRAEEELA